MAIKFIKKYEKRETINNNIEISYYDLFIFNKLWKVREARFNTFISKWYPYNILSRDFEKKYDQKCEIVKNKYFETEYSEYNEIKYTYLLYIVDNMGGILNQGSNRELGKDIEELIKKYGEEKNWSHILLSNWGYNFEPLNEDNKNEYKNNNFSKFDNRLLYIPDLFNLNEKEYKRYKDSYLLNIEYKNNIETGALFRFK